VPAVEELTACGVNVNVTLLFSVQRYEEVIEAYLRGLERRAPSGEPLGGIASVASFFVSRVDTKAEAQLPDESPLRGRIAIANAHRAYGRCLARFSGER
jgi:transaldolase